MINCIWFWGEQTSQLETIGNWPQEASKAGKSRNMPKTSNLLSGKIEAGVLVHARFELASGEEIEIYWWLVVRVAFFFFFFSNLLDKPYRYGYWNWITLETYTQTSSYNNTLESFSYRAILHLDHLISVYPKCIMGSLSVSLEFFCLFQEAILEIPEHKAGAKNLNNEIVKWVQDNCAGIPSHELHRFTGIWMVS